MARTPGPFTVPHFRAWARELVLDNGEPWIVEPFFEAFVADYFAGIPECWLIVPEGNTKTTSLAGLAGYLLEHRTVAGIPWAASSREQAEIGYRQLEGLALRSPRLREIFKCQEGYRRVKNMLTGGRVQIFAADDNHADGIIPTDAFIDELHRHKNLRLYRTWRGKLGKRAGQMAAISTAGEPGSEFEETREQIRQMTAVIARRPGFVHCRSESIALHEYAVAEGGDVSDMVVVKQANPFSLITVETLAAKRATPTMTLAHWQRFTCNQPTRGVSAAITELEWAGATATTLPGGMMFDDSPEIPAGEPVDLGLDLGWKHDTTAMVPLWMPAFDYRLLGPATVLEPPRDGSMLDPHLVELALLEVNARNPIGTVVMDMTDGAQLAQWIEAEIGAQVVDRLQSLRLAIVDYARFMEALREGWLRHCGDKPLTRHVLNAVAQVLPRGDVCFTRASTSRASSLQAVRVIDALVAAAMVHTWRAAEFAAPGLAEPMVAYG